MTLSDKGKKRLNLAFILDERATFINCGRAMMRLPWDHNLPGGTPEEVARLEKIIDAHPELGIRGCMKLYDKEVGYDPL